jgi:putative addiction module component (TIGR02574 family)
MTQDLLELEQKASRLSDDERAQLALFLLESLEPTEDIGSEDAWRIEAESRLCEIERGEARLVPVEEVFENLRRRLA